MLRMDGDPLAVKLMLEYIYCGRIISETAWENYVNVSNFINKFL